MGSLLEAFIVCVAPKSLANSNFSSFMSTAIIGYASSKDAILIADNPTPPTPYIATESPGLTLAVFRTAPAPVRMAQPTIQVISVG